MGEATFEGRLGSHVAVRSIQFQELKLVVKAMKRAWARHFSALLALRGALESMDEVQLRHARERLSKAILMLERERPRRSGFSGESPEYAAEEEKMLREWQEHTLAFFFKTERMSGVNEDAFRLLSYEVSRVDGLRGARLVLWWKDGRFVPAIYCDCPMAALYVHTFLIAPAGDVGYRDCPKCGEPFQQKRADQDYCTPAHREAHRVARWRARKEDSADQGSKRRRDGTQKTR